MEHETSPQRLSRTVKPELLGFGLVRKICGQQTETSRKQKCRTPLSIITPRVHYTALQNILPSSLISSKKNP